MSKNIMGFVNVKILGKTEKNVLADVSERAGEARSLSNRFRGAKKAFHHAGPFCFILPGLLGFLTFYIVPFLISVGYSFLSRPIGGSFVGLQNYIDLVGAGSFRLGVRNTIIFIAICVPINMALSLMLAVFIQKIGRGRSLFVLIFLIPLVIPSGSMVFFWQMLFAWNGVLNGILHTLFDVRINWLNSAYARLVVMTIFLWKNLGFNLVLFLAGLQNIPKEYYEAADVDGAGPIERLKSITLPCLAPTLVLVLIMSLINSFKAFREIYLLMGNYPHESVYMLQHFMNNMFFSLNYPRLTTATVLLVLVITLLTQFLFKLERKVS